MGTKKTAGYRISVDTGGTFTDVVVSDAAGNFAVGKSPTTYGRIFDGFSRAVSQASRALGVDLAAVMKDCEHVIYATTHATNSVVMRSTANTALVITAGFEDTLEYREGGRSDVFNNRLAYTPPFVPRSSTYGIRERINAEGEVLTPLSWDALERLAAAIAAGNHEAIAVSLIWSVANSKHELEIGAFLRDAFPGIPISLSHEINPIIREYRRTSSAAINAALSPAMASHFGDLADDLTACGFTGDCLVVTSEGGLQPIEKVTVRPILAVNSGPAMAPLAAARYAAEREAIIVCDIGGTTFDVSLVEGGHLAQSREYWLGQRYLGELTGVSSVAVKSVGAGGGSIAVVDAGGLLRVGPRSAGSQPGPACYAQGGELPTVTDAAAVLGYLNADAGSGRFAVRADLAEGALRAHVSQQLGLELAYAARSVLKIAAVGSAAAARETILAEGLDPRTLSMVACGGAGALLACAIADELDIREIVVPLNAGVMAALGAHNASIVSELSVPVVPQPGVSDAENLLRNRATLADKVSSYIANELDGYSHPVQRHFAEARYRGQIWELRIDIPPEILDREDLHAQISEAFHALHQKKNSVCDEAAPVEIVSLGCRVSAELPPRMLKAAATTTSDSSNEALSDSRLDGHALLPGWSGDGPLYIDCPTTTLVVEEGWRAVKDGDDRFVLTRDMKEA